MIDEKKLWLKISGSINYYLRDCDLEKCDDKLLKDYLYYALNEEEGTYSYLDKQTFEFIDLDAKIVERTKEAFLERIARKRLKEPLKVSKEKTKEEYKSKNNVVNFLDYKNNR